MTDLSICVITPTIGRPTLRRTLESAKLGPLDNWEVITDGPEIYKKVKPDILDLLNSRRYLHYSTTFRVMGHYGNRLRDTRMSITENDYFVFLDDDDVFAPGAIEIIKEAIAQHHPRPIIFKMRNGNGETLWKNREVTPGNVGGSMFVCPNDPDKLGKWDNGQGHRSDIEFIRQTLENYGPGWRQDIVWSDEVIIHCRPDKDKFDE